MLRFFLKKMTKNNRHADHQKLLRESVIPDVRFVSLDEGQEGLMPQNWKFALLRPEPRPKEIESQHNTEKMAAHVKLIIQS
jgi:hypothetical protein